MKKENFKNLMNSWNDLLNEGPVALPISGDYIEEDAFFMPSSTPGANMQANTDMNMLDKASSCIAMAHSGDDRLAEMVKEICSVNGEPETLAKCINLCMCACKCDRNGCCDCLSEICKCAHCAQVCKKYCGC